MQSETLQQEEAFGEGAAKEDVEDAPGEEDKDERCGEDSRRSRTRLPARS